MSYDGISLKELKELMELKELIELKKLRELKEIKELKEESNYRIFFKENMALLSLKNDGKSSKERLKEVNEMWKLKKEIDDNSSTCSSNDTVITNTKKKNKDEIKKLKSLLQESNKEYKTEHLHLNDCDYSGDLHKHVGADGKNRYKQCIQCKDIIKQIEDKLNIETTSNAPINFVITNALGETVVQKTNFIPIAIGTVNLDVSALPKGIYFLSIETEKGNKVFKVMKE